MCEALDSEHCHCHILLLQFYCMLLCASLRILRESEGLQRAVRLSACVSVSVLPTSHSTCIGALHLNPDDRPTSTSSRVSFNTYFRALP